MLRRFVLIALAGLATTTPAVAQDATTVGERPALSTNSVQDLFAQREKWGTAPSAKQAAKSEAPPPAKSVKTAASTSDGYTVLPTDNVKNLIAEREKWGTAPSGSKRKAVAAPPTTKKATRKTAKAAPSKKRKKKN